MWHGPTATSTDGEPEIDHYKLLNTIGQGSFVKVMLARHILTGMEVAVKVIHREGLSKDSEFRCLSVLNHPNIAKLFEVIETHKTLYLVMERVHGVNMCEYLKAHGRLNENKAQGVFRQLLSAVEYCHRRGIVHRDLKADNVMLDSDLNVKLIDFGLGSESICCGSVRFYGTFHYAAPETYLGQCYDGTKTDTWSLGVLLYAMVTASLPFKGKGLWELRRVIQKGVFRVPAYITSDCVNMLRKLITVNPRDRETLENIMRHPWLNVGQKEVLRPYTEPHCDNLEPRVTQTLMNMGFQKEDIEASVANRRYNRLMGTYLMIKTRMANERCLTIKVKPYMATDLDGPGPSPNYQVQAVGWQGIETASAPDSLKSSNNIPKYSLESSTGTPQPSAGPRASNQPPSQGPRTTILSPSARPIASSPPPSAGPMASTQLPSQGPRTTILPPNPRPISSTLPPSAGPIASSPPHSPRPRDSTQSSSQGPRTTILPPSAGPISSTPLPSLVPIASSAPPSPGPMTSTPPHSPRPRASTQLPSQGPRTTILPPSPVPIASSPPPSPEPIASTPPHSPRPRDSTQLPSQGPRTTILPPSPRPISSTLPPSPCPISSTLPPSAGPISSTLPPSAGPISSTPPPSAGPRASTPLLREGPRTTILPPSTGTIDSTPLPNTEVLTSFLHHTPLLRAATPSQALQRGPWWSRYTHNTKSSSSSSSSGDPVGTNMTNSLHAGHPDGVAPASSSGHSQGSKRLARRILARILKHLCCCCPTTKN